MRKTSPTKRLPDVPVVAAAVPMPADPPKAEVPPSRFDIAAARAMGRYTPAEWALLEPSRRTSAIYTELRRLDAEAGGHVPGRGRPRP